MQSVCTTTWHNKKAWLSSQRPPCIAQPLKSLHCANLHAEALHPCRIPSRTACSMPSMIPPSLDTALQLVHFLCDRQAPLTDPLDHVDELQCLVAREHELPFDLQDVLPGFVHSHIGVWSTPSPFAVVCQLSGSSSFASRRGSGGAVSFCSWGALAPQYA